MQGADATRDLIVDVLTFQHDINYLHTRRTEMPTPAFAVPRQPHDIMFAIGGWSIGQSLTYVEAYDTRADRWIRVAEEDPFGPRAYHGCAVIGERIYCIGGYDGVEHFNTCRMFDVRTREWSEIAPLHSARCYVGVAVVAGLVYACGGFNGQARLNTAERYDPATNQWTMLRPMNAIRSDADACELNGRVYVTGGFNGQECLNSVEYYDVAEAEWYVVPPMLTRRSGVSCVAMRGMLYVMGGFNGMTRMNTCER